MSAVWIREKDGVVEAAAVVVHGASEEEAYRFVSTSMGNIRRLDSAKGVRLGEPAPVEDE